MEYAKRTLGVGTFFYFIGLLVMPMPHAKVLSATAGAIGTILLIGGSITWIVLRIRAHKMPSAINTIRALMFVTVTFLLPFGVAGLASSGGTFDAIFRGNGYGWPHWVAQLLSSWTLAGPYAVLIELPHYLFQYAPRSQVSDRTRTLLPSWGSGGSALLAATLVTLMHFANGPLANVSIERVIVAAFAVATLLLPFFRWLINIVWTLGVTRTFSFRYWKSSASSVIEDIESDRRDPKAERTSHQVSHLPRVCQKLRRMPEARRQAPADTGVYPKGITCHPRRY